MHGFGLGIIETQDGWREERAVELVCAAVDDLAAGIDKLLHCRCHIVTLLDIDTPTKQVVRYSLNVATGELSEPEVVVDLTSGDDFPDGMIATPDGQSVIIAFYNPNEVDFGAARQYSLQDGSLEAVWTVEKSPRVTCPQLVRIDGSVKLILTTADEGMTPEQQARHTNAGCLFIADTDFDDVPDTPVFHVSE